MKLQINDPKNVIDRNFIAWFLIKIRNKIIQDINDDKLIVWNTYFQKNPVYKSIYKKNINTRDLIIAGASNLDFTKSANSFYIVINSNIQAPTLNGFKLDTICKLINFGNIDIKGYPIFTNTFEYFAKNIQDYVNMYVNGMLK